MIHRTSSMMEKQAWASQKMEGNKISGNGFLMKKKIDIDVLDRCWEGKQFPGGERRRGYPKKNVGQK